MRNQKQTFRKIISFLNNPEEEGGFWLPNIQRPFVWSEKQICKLFDSILREYPISTLLVWKTTSDIRRRRFIDNWNDGLRLSDFYVPKDNGRKCLVLDGQQRLQGLFIGLKGSFEGRELYFDILSGGEASMPDDVKFAFDFMDQARARFPWVKFKDLVFAAAKQSEMRARLKASADREFTVIESTKIDDHLDLVDRTFKIDEALTYQELDSIDNPQLYTEDDVVEVFIRANSGGTKLGKSDLLFSLLGTSWEVADDKMEDLLDSLNRYGFEFDRDFVLKTALSVLGQGARYEVQKFRRRELREEVKERWESIAEAIQDVLDFVRSKTYIQCDKALPTYLVLIPLIYVRYHFPDAWKRAKDRDTYILRCSLAGAFGGSPDNLLDALTRRFAEIKDFRLDDAFGVIRSQGRSLELTEDRFWKMGYGSDKVHLLFNIWYRDFGYTPAYENNLPQIDHIFPQSALRQVKVLNPTTGRKDLARYSAGERDQLANCMLLTRNDNGPGGKSDTLPSEWFADKDACYLEENLIPPDPSLWKMDHFDKFIEARKALIRQRFSLLFAPSTAAEARQDGDDADSLAVPGHSAEISDAESRPGLDVVVAGGLLDRFLEAQAVTHEDVGALESRATAVDLLDRFVDARATQVRRSKDLLDQAALIRGEEKVQ